MELISDTSLKNNLSDILDQVNNDHIPIVITREKGKSVVLMSLDDFKSYSSSDNDFYDKKNNSEKLFNLLDNSLEKIASKNKITTEELIDILDPSKPLIESKNDIDS